MDILDIISIDAVWQEEDMDTENEITATELAEKTGDVINRVHYGRQPIMVTRRGKPVVVIVDVETWARIDEHESNEKSLEV
jgi:prevent-host-death family protein